MRRGAIRCSAACRQRRAAGERLNGKSVVVCCMTSRTRVGREGRRQVDRSAGGRGQVGCGSEGPSGSRNQSDGKLKRHGRDPVACYWAGGSVCSVSVALRCVSFVSASGPVNPAAVRSPGIPAGLVLVPLCRLFLVLPFLFFFSPFRRLFLQREVAEGKGRREEMGWMCRRPRVQREKREKQQHRHQQAPAGSPLPRAWDELWLWAGGVGARQAGTGNEGGRPVSPACAFGRLHWEWRGWSHTHSNPPVTVIVPPAWPLGLLVLLWLRVFEGAHSPRAGGVGTVRLGRGGLAPPAQQNLVGGRLAS